MAELTKKIDRVLNVYETWSLNCRYLSDVNYENRELSKLLNKLSDIFYEKSISLEQNCSIEMTPQEKAFDLVSSFYFENVNDIKENKRLALLTVKEIIKTVNYISCEEIRFNYDYWLEVEKEINKIESLIWEERN